MLRKEINNTLVLNKLFCSMKISKKYDNFNDLRKNCSF